MAVVALTGFTPAPGRTALTARLAWTYVNLGCRVLVIDTEGDPALRQLLGGIAPTKPFTIGFCDAMVGAYEPQVYVEETRIHNLDLMGPGDHLPEIEDAFEDPDELPVAAQRVINALRPTYDVLLMHTPATYGPVESFLAVAAADVVLTVAPPGNYGLEPTPEEAQDMRIMQEEGINPNLQRAGTVIVEPGPGGEGVSSKSVATALCKLGRFVFKN